MAINPMLNKGLQPEKWFEAQIPILGIEGQHALGDKSIFIEGAGGIGSPVAFATARVGFARICHSDPQLIELDNLNRIFAGPQHVGRRKVEAVKDFLLRFDRLHSDREFSYVPLPFPVEHEAVQPHLEEADFLIACANSLAARLYLLRYAVEHKKSLLNVGFGCSPGNYMNGEVSVYRPQQPELACPACVSLDAPQQADTASDPLIYPPLAILAALTVHLLVAEITDFDSQGDARPNFFFYDGYAHDLRGLRVQRNPNCAICGSRETRETSDAHLPSRQAGGFL